MVFIEVKQVGQIEGADRQLFEYAFHTGVPIVILTDGREWHFFHPSGQGDYRERLVCQLHLIETDSEETAERLNRYLNYGLVCNGEASQAIADDYQDVYKQRVIKTNLPEAWIKLVEEADEFLLHTVAEKTESLCGHRPTGEQVLDFLKSLERADPGPTNGNSRTRLVVTMPNGENIAHNTAVATFVAVIERLGIEKVREVYPKLVSTSEFPRGNRKVGQYYVNTHSPTKEKKRQLKYIADKLDIPLIVEIVAKESN